ncbi:TetR-like C-terminal domain-containing protein [Streptomyces sp. NRRL S-813]|uniref:TetR-like C-terminal domain-containing protein n=1 Tax=Streptomyces sp. NRRL S-813 TaxID=1463919 RepID=UPI00099CA6DB
MRPRLRPAASRVRTIYQRAHDRGEIDLERIPAAVLAIPFDLVRHDLLMDLEPLKPARVRSVIDELYLPLVHNTTTGRVRQEPTDPTHAPVRSCPGAPKGQACLVTRLQHVRRHTPTTAQVSTTAKPGTGQ